MHAFMSQVPVFAGAVMEGQQVDSHQVPQRRAKLSTVVL